MYVQIFTPRPLSLRSSKAGNRRAQQSQDPRFARVFPKSPKFQEASMPSTTDKPFKIPAIDGSELQSLPTWARSEYRKSQEVVFQLIQQMVKLESNIGDLETMLEKGECPRSLQVNVKVSVANEQQSNVDAALLANKKIFEENMLKALITARKGEHSTKKTLLQQKRNDFILFLESTLTELKQNNIPLPAEEYDTDAAVNQCLQLFEERADMVMREVKTQYFFMMKAALRRKQERTARIQEVRINDMLIDTAIPSMAKKIETLEKSLHKVQAERNRSTTTVGRPATRSRTKQVASRQPRATPTKSKWPRPKQSFPKGPGPSKNRNSTAAPKTLDGRGPTRFRRNINQDPVRGNRKPSRRFTNTTTRSVSRPRAFPKRRN